MDVNRFFFLSRKEMQTLINELVSLNSPLTQDFAIFQTNTWGPAHEFTFWLRVLRDHMFILNSRLAPSETELIDLTQQLYNTGEMLRRYAFDSISRNNITGQYLQDIISYGNSVRNVKKTILDRQLNGLVRIGVTPTVISHMMNELEQFMFIATYFTQNGVLPPKRTYNHHELWMSDIIGHLDVIKADLDGVEKLLRKEIKKKKRVFEKLYMKLLEFTNYYKHGVEVFPGLDKLNRNASDETLVYLRLVSEVLRQVQNKEALGRLDPEYLIHMLFEEVFYLHTLRLAQEEFEPLQKYSLVPLGSTMNVIQQLNQ